MPEGPIQNPSANQEKNPLFAKQEWFNAYYRGNALIPQAGTGITLSILISLVKRGVDLDLTRFARSEFSPSQLKTLGDAMSAMHRHKNINVSTASQAHTFIDKPPHIVEDKVLQRLWYSSRKVVFVALLSYVTGQSARPIHNFSELIAVGEELQLFFDKSENIDALNMLKEVLTEIDELLTNDLEVRALLMRFRSEFKNIDPSHSRETDQIWGNRYAHRFKNIIENNLEKKLGTKLPHKMKNFIETAVLTP